jgi:transcriptional regulator with XRE-family HTH domain
MPDNELQKAFGLRLRSLRKQHHWTLKELAAKLEVQPSQLNKYECGINWPAADKIVEIAALFHTSTDYLLQGSPADDLPLRNHRLLDRFRALEDFPIADQETLIAVIDAFILKQRVVGALLPVDHPNAKNLLPPAIANSASTAKPAKTRASSASKALPAKSRATKSSRSRSVS